MINELLKKIGLLVILLGIFVFVLPVLSRLKVTDNVKLLNMVKAVIIWGIVVLYYFLTKDIKDDFHFELTPEKRCEGGPYLWSSNPEKAALCSKFSKADLARYECSNGFIGRPIWRQGAGNMPLSDANWQNTTCDQIGKDLPDP